MALMKEILVAKNELDQLQKQVQELQQQTGNKQVAVLSLSQRLEGLCDLIISTAGPEEEVDQEVVSAVDEYVTPQTEEVTYQE